MLNFRNYIGLLVVRHNPRQKACYGLIEKRLLLF